MTPTTGKWQPTNLNPDANPNVGTAVVGTTVLGIAVVGTANDCCRRPPWLNSRANLAIKKRDRLASIAKKVWSHG